MQPMRFVGRRCLLKPLRTPHLPQEFSIPSVAGSIDIFCYQNFSTKNIASKNETGSRVGLNLQTTNSRNVQRPLATDCLCVSSKITKRLSEYYFFTYMSTSTATITNSTHTVPPFTHTSLVHFISSQDFCNLVLPMLPTNSK